MAQSLENLCVDRIVADFDKLCEDRDDLHRFLYIIGPFDGLGTHLIHQIIMKLMKKKRLTLSYLEMLLQPCLTRLDLSKCTFVNDTTVRTIARRCKKLIQLSLKDRKFISFKAIRELIPVLSNLCSLDMTNCFYSCNDNLLQVIGDHCHNIQVLKLANCLNITDNGIRAICGSEEKPKCQRIVELDISFTGMSSKGLHRIMDSKRDLRSLTAQCTCIDNTFSLSGYPSDQIMYNLKSLDLSYTLIGDQGIVSICTFCVFLEALYLNDCQQVQGNWLKSIASLEMLKHLYLGVCSDLDHRSDIRPFLEHRGVQLESLQLCNTGNISANAFESCCNLVELRLPECTFVYESDIELYLLEACYNLKVLDLHKCELSASEELYSDLLDTVFSTANGSSSIEELNLCGCECFVSSDLEYYFEEGLFSNLEKLDISSCPDICKDLAIVAVRHCPKLKYLNLQQCRNVTNHHYHELKKMAKSLGLKTAIFWS
ncbi:predicted protein [Nematostella vectensis]|uniref:Uncharacterized protein n=1 Tax=Nematostella vectensis TaxID=45351 RepID=A7RZG7_NEMVE|nr:predicted protein [Nematostella vectensis]|eukprot:XP_001635209.1 predicted protein [Nematostella vectensis]